MKRLFYILLFVSFFVGSIAAPKAPFNKGANFSNWFQDKSVNLVGFTKYTKQDFLNLKSMGGDAVRLPINFHGMSSGSPDYIIDPQLFTLLDTVVTWADELEMYLILDNHSYDASFNNSAELESILRKMWRQIADHYKGQSSFILYEIINEPDGRTNEVWGLMMKNVISAIREKDQTHTIVVSPQEWSSFKRLKDLPVFEDKNLLYTIHFYGPFLFTHQGASWVGLDSLRFLPFPYGASKMPVINPVFKGTWVESDLVNYNTGGTVARMKQQIAMAADFANTRNVPVFCGEFGVYRPYADPAQRVLWYKTVREILESYGIAWTIWDYHFSFGIFNAEQWGSFEHDVNVPLVDALGFKAPAQTPNVKMLDSKNLVVYDDYLTSGILDKSLAFAKINYYDTKSPGKGQYALSVAGYKLNDALSIDFIQDRDFSVLKNGGYALEFMCRSDVATKYSVRFVDTKVSATDHPWRAQSSFPVVADQSGTKWQKISIPLTKFADFGAWDDNKWYISEKKFDWTQIDRLEFVADQASVGNSVIYFDEIKIIIPGSDAIVMPKPILPPAETGLVDGNLDVPVKDTAVAVVVVPEVQPVTPSEGDTLSTVVADTSAGDLPVIIDEYDVLNDVSHPSIVVGDVSADSVPDIAVGEELQTVPVEDSVVDVVIDETKDTVDMIVVLPVVEDTVGVGIVPPLDSTDLPVTDVSDISPKPTDEIGGVVEEIVIPVVIEPEVDSVIDLDTLVADIPEYDTIVDLVVSPVDEQNADTTLTDDVEVPSEVVIEGEVPIVTDTIIDEIDVVIEPSADSIPNVGDLTDDGVGSEPIADSVLTEAEIVELEIIPDEADDSLDVLLPVVEEVAEAIDTVGEIPEDTSVVELPVLDAGKADSDTVELIPDDTIDDLVVGDDNGAGTIDELKDTIGGIEPVGSVPDTINVEVDIVDLPSLTDDTLGSNEKSDTSAAFDGNGSGTVKFETVTSVGEKTEEPFYFRLDKGWMIIESEQPIVSVTILDATLKLVKKEEGVTRVLVEYLPRGNYFIVLKFADGTESVKPVTF